MGVFFRLHITDKNVHIPIIHQQVSYYFCTRYITLPETGIKLQNIAIVLEIFGFHQLYTLLRYLICGNRWPELAWQLLKRMSGQQASIQCSVGCVGLSVCLSFW